MPTFIAAIGGMILRGLPIFVGQVLLSLGIGIVTYTGMDMTLDRLKSDAVTALLGLPPQVVALLSYMKVGVAISIVTSALAIRMGVTAANGAVKRFRKK